MATINFQKAREITSKCFNEWEIDYQYLLYHNEKQLQKTIYLNDEKTEYIRYRLYFDFENKIMLNWNKGKIENGFGVSQGFGKHKIIDETTYTRKSINKLIELTESLTDEILNNYNKETSVTRNSIFVASPDF